MFAPRVYFLALSLAVAAEGLGQIRVAYEWKSLEFEWPSEEARRAAEKKGEYVAENNIISAIKTYEGSVYLTVPRWRRGVPSTLNKVVVGEDGKPHLRPFPSRKMQTVGDCSALQYAAGLEIDPITGRMYILDTGRLYLPETSASALDVCPPKIVIYDLKRGQTVQTYAFANGVASSNTSFLNDLVIDRGGYVYITDASGLGGLIVYDSRNRSARRFADRSMQGDAEKTVIEIDKVKYSYLQVPIDSLAMSPDFEYLYFCSFSGERLHQIPTKVLTDATDTGLMLNEHVRMIGVKRSKSRGLSMGQKGLYFGSLVDHSIRYWDRVKDISIQQTESTVTLRTTKELVRNPKLLHFQESYGWDENGYLWVASNRMSMYLEKPDSDVGAFTTKVLKIEAQDYSYLSRYGKWSPNPNGGSCVQSSFVLCLAGLLCALLVSTNIYSWTLLLSNVAGYPAT